MRRIAHLTYAVVLVVMALALSAGSASAGGTFIVSACTKNRATLDAFLAFNTTLSKYRTAHLIALHDAISQAELWLSRADADSNSIPKMMADGDMALTFTHTSREALDRLDQDRIEMKRAVDGGAFGRNQRAKSKADQALTALDSWLKQLRTVVNHLNHAALAYSIGARAVDEFQQATHDLVAPLNGLALAGRDLDLARTLLGSECADAAQPVPPMSPSQIGGISKGGGSQRTGTGGLSVLAPKRVNVNRRGRTTLPLTIAQPARGEVDVTLSRGQAVVAYVHASMGARYGKAGLLLQLPRATHAGSARLTVAFTPSYVPGKATTAKTVKLTVRIV